MARRSRSRPVRCIYRDSASVEKGNKSLPQGEFLPGAVPRHSGLFRPLQGSGAFCKARGLCYTLPVANRFRLFLGSSAVEHSTVNRMVAGSNPARGANKTRHFLHF